MHSDSILWACHFTNGNHSFGPPHYPHALVNHVGYTSFLKVGIQIKAQAIQYYSVHHHTNNYYFSTVVLNITGFTDNVTICCSVEFNKWLSVILLFEYVLSFQYFHFVVLH